MSGTDWYKGVTRTGRTYVSAAYRSNAPGHPERARRCDSRCELRHRPSGFLVITFSLDSTQRFVDYFAQSLGVDITLTDQRGTLLARPGNKQGKLVSLARTIRGVADALRGGERRRHAELAAGRLAVGAMPR